MNIDHILLFGLINIPTKVENMIFSEETIDDLIMIV